MPAEPLEHGDGDALACGLYRQALYWALAAHAGRNDPAVPAPVEAVTLAELWSHASGELIARAAAGTRGADALHAALADQSFVDDAARSPVEAKKLARELAVFVERVLEPLASEQRKMERRWVRRLAVFAALAVALALAVTGIELVSRVQRRTKDLARGAEFATSSTHPEGGCVSPAQRCESNPNFFFCTSFENDPWIVFDLGAERAISGIWVENRLDCCWERAVPLVVEVSRDRQNWQPVARREAVFTTWHGRFRQTRARFVKLHVPRQTLLHLATVRILP